jgi:hypothetical protein
MFAVSDRPSNSHPIHKSIVVVVVVVVLVVVFIPIQWPSLGAAMPGESPPRADVLLNLYTPKRLIEATNIFK